MAPYRPGQGVYARAGTAGALILLSLFGTARLFGLLPSESSFDFLGMPVPHSVLWTGLVFVLVAALVFLFTFGPHTGLASLDAKTHALIDLLIDTEAELGKVFWPGRDDLVRSTTAVLVSIVLFGVFLLGVDWFFGFVMTRLGVLPV